jgi:hypothetical protein
MKMKTLLEKTKNIQKKYIFTFLIVIFVVILHAFYFYRGNEYPLEQGLLEKKEEEISKLNKEIINLKDDFTKNVDSQDINEDNAYSEKDLPEFNEIDISNTSSIFSIGDYRISLVYPEKYKVEVNDGLKLMATVFDTKGDKDPLDTEILRIYPCEGVFNYGEYINENIPTILLSNMSFAGKDYVGLYDVTGEGFLRYYEGDEGYDSISPEENLVVNYLYVEQFTKVSPNICVSIYYEDSEGGEYMTEVEGEKQYPYKYETLDQDILEIKDILNKAKIEYIKQEN